MPPSEVWISLATTTFSIISALTDLLLAAQHWVLYDKEGILRALCLSCIKVFCCVHKQVLVSNELRGLHGNKRMTGTQILILRRLGQDCTLIWPTKYVELRGNHHYTLYYMISCQHIFLLQYDELRCKVLCCPIEILYFKSRIYVYYIHT